MERSKIKAKEPIRLREKSIANGNKSLYLDMYLNGKRSYEFLRLYLIPEKTKEDKETNRKTLQLANAVKAKRIVEAQNHAHGFESFAMRDVLFLAYFESLCKDVVWRTTLKHIKVYESNHSIKLSQITREWAQGFADYLKVAGTFRETESEELSFNTQRLYLSKLSGCLSKAVKQGIIAYNPAIGIDKPKFLESERMHLTVDEIRTLSNSKCRYPELKRAFLFSCLTGMRYSDIVNLTWGNVYRQGEHTRISFRQQKTKGLVYLDISPQAAELLGEVKSPTSPVFSLEGSRQFQNAKLTRWVRDAGIAKKITFHCARHTFAIMMIDLDTDIYTISKLLGHSDVKTTQIYAKMLDKRKQAAVGKIPQIL